MNILQEDSLSKFYKERYMLLIYGLYKTVDLLLFIIFLFVKVVWLKGESLKRIYTLDIFNTKNCFRILKEDINLLKYVFFLVYFNKF